ATRSHEITSPSVVESAEVGRPNACNLCHLDRTLAWTADELERWYGTRPVPLRAEQQALAAGVLWLLRGDAAQRALTAWSMGWEPARRASRDDWLGLYLALLLTDPYDAVRSIAYRSLRTLEPFAGFDYDFMAPPLERKRAARRAVATWAKAGGHVSSGPELLIARPGVALESQIHRLLESREERSLLVVE
ncbi:MAG: C cytochrome precursor, partial [Thermodesulfobacteriota bacterium]